jgi:hypothetical protein
LQMVQGGKTIQIQQSVSGAQPASSTTTLGTAVSSTTGQPAAPSQPSAESERRIEAVRMHLQRYRDLTAQGKWSDAGKELEAIQGLVGK